MFKYTGFTTIHYENMVWTAVICPNMGCIIWNTAKKMKGMHFDYRYMLVFKNCVAIKLWKSPKSMSYPKWFFYFSYPKSLTYYCRLRKVRIEHILNSKIKDSKIIKILDANRVKQLLLNPPTTKGLSRTTIYCIDQSLKYDPFIIGGNIIPANSLPKNTAMQNNRNVKSTGGTLRARLERKST